MKLTAALASEAANGPAWMGRRRADQLDAGIDLDWLIERAPDLVSRGLRVMRDEGLTVAEAAAAIGTTRFTLRRQIDKLAAAMAEAYAEYRKAA